MPEESAARIPPCKCRAAAGRLTRSLLARLAVSRLQQWMRYGCNFSTLRRGIASRTQHYICRCCRRVCTSKRCDFTRVASVSANYRLSCIYPLKMQRPSYLLLRPGCWLASPLKSRGWKMLISTDFEKQRFSSKALCMSHVLQGAFLYDFHQFTFHRIRASHNTDALLDFEQEAAYGRFPQDEGGS